MDIMKETAAEAFAELERDSIHPSDEEIAAAAEGTASAFSAAEVRAHAGWCSRCGEVAADFQQFCRPAQGSFSNEEVEWSWHRFRRTLSTGSSRHRWTRVWMAAAAGFFFCASLSTLWYLQNGARPPEIAQEKPAALTAELPVLVAANAPVIDLFPERTVSRGDAPASAARLPEQLPRVAMIILNTPGFRGNEASARVLDSGGREVWTGKLTQQSGVFTLAVGEEILRQRPLTVELAGPGGATVNYRLQ
jgi:hypothetical protein